MLPNQISLGLRCMEEDGIIVPVTTVLPAAPKAVIELVKCGQSQSVHKTLSFKWLELYRAMWLLRR